MYREPRPDPKPEKQPKAKKKIRKVSKKLSRRLEVYRIAKRVYFKIEKQTVAAGQGSTKVNKTIKGKAKTWEAFIKAKNQSK